LVRFESQVPQPALTILPEDSVYSFLVILLTPYGLLLIDEIEEVTKFLLFAILLDLPIYWSSVCA
jgi:hypothetical protein